MAHKASSARIMFAGLAAHTARAAYVAFPAFSQALVRLPFAWGRRPRRSGFGIHLALVAPPAQTVRVCIKKLTKKSVLYECAYV